MEQNRTKEITRMNALTNAIKYWEINRIPNGLIKEKEIINTAQVFEKYIETGDTE